MGASQRARQLRCYGNPAPPHVCFAGSGEGEGTRGRGERPDPVTQRTTPKLPTEVPQPSGLGQNTPTQPERAKPCQRPPGQRHNTARLARPCGRTAATLCTQAGFPTKPTVPERGEGARGARGFPKHATPGRGERERGRVVRAAGRPRGCPFARLSHKSQRRSLRGPAREAGKSKTQRPNTNEQKRPGQGHPPEANQHT